MGNMGSGGCCGGDKNKTQNKPNTGTCATPAANQAKAGQGAPQTPNANKK